MYTALELGLMDARHQEFRTDAHTVSYDWKELSKFHPLHFKKARVWKGIFTGPGRITHWHRIFHQRRCTPFLEATSTTLVVMLLSNMLFTTSSTASRLLETKIGSSAVIEMQKLNQTKWNSRETPYVQQPRSSLWPRSRVYVRCWVWRPFIEKIINQLSTNKADIFRHDLGHINSASKARLKAAGAALRNRTRDREIAARLWGSIVV